MKLGVSLEWAIEQKVYVPISYMDMKKTIFSLCILIILIVSLKARNSSFLIYNWGIPCKVTLEVDGKALLSVNMDSEQFVYFRNIDTEKMTFTEKEAIWELSYDNLRKDSVYKIEYKKEHGFPIIQPVVEEMLLEHVDKKEYYQEFEKDRVEAEFHQQREDCIGWIELS